MAAIRDTTDDGGELVTFMLRVMRGKVFGATLRDRMEAATWLADRAFGKPVPAVPTPAEHTQLSLEAVRAVFARASDPDKVYDE